jgi:chaperone modulatory protein CbpM
VDILSVDAVELDDTGALTVAQLVECSGLTEVEVRTLVECGALLPHDPAAPTWTFGARCVLVARRAHRLREEFALEDVHALAVVLRLVERIESLERALDATGARRVR